MNSSSNTPATDPALCPGLIAITGGIGSGKSAVASAVGAMGYEVYDCDSRARSLMESPEIMGALRAEFGSDIFRPSGTLRREALSAIVFADPARLEALNAIVHGAVRTDLAAWALARSRSGRGPIFVETAILYQSRLDRMVERVWEVTAPRELRIERVARRNGLARPAIEARIEAQDSFIPSALHPRVDVIVNDGITPLLPRIESLLSLSQQ